MLGDFIDRLEKISKNAEQFGKKKSIPFEELFSRDFLQTCTSFKSIGELFESGNIKINNPEEFEAIPKEILDDLISRNTSFETWHAFDQGALRFYINKSLGVKLL